MMHFIKELLDAINTDGGHIVIAIGLLFVGLFVLIRWQVSEGKDLFMFAIGVLALAMKSSGKANGQVTSTTTTTEVKLQEKQP